jgi:hypothetical protein
MTTKHSHAANVTYTASGRIIDVLGMRLYECQCDDKDCGEKFFTASSYSCPPSCPSCEKSVHYTSEHDL